MKSAAAETHIQREPGAGKGFVYRRALFASEQYGGTAHRAVIGRKSVDYVSKVGWYRGTLLRLVLFCGILLQSGRAFLFFGPADTIDAHTVRDKERKYL